MADEPFGQARRRPAYVLRPEDVCEPPLSCEDRRDYNRAVSLFNQGAYWESHEAWEAVWRRCDHPCRIFYQALIQLAAAFHQMERGIHHGLVKHLANAGLKLQSFPDRFLGADVKGLRRAASLGLSEADRLGPGATTRFNRRLVPTLSPFADD